MEAEDLVGMLKSAEFVGAWKALNWLSRQLSSSVTVEDVVKCLEVGSEVLEKKLAEAKRR